MSHDVDLCTLQMMSSLSSWLTSSESFCLMWYRIILFGFSKEALKLMKSYLKNQKQKVQITNKFSSERDVIAGVPQGSIDGPLSFNLFINDLTFFIEQCTLSNYADDNNLSISGADKKLIKFMLSSDFMILEDRFFGNYTILNLGKCYFMCIWQKCKRFRVS